MRNVVSISLPTELLKLVKSYVKKGKFSSTSEFFRHILREWEEAKLAREVAQSRREFEKGKGKLLRSLDDLR